jgi:phage repressor protein C with HTH and peptisase S24 domain
MEENVENLVSERLSLLIDNLCNGNEKRFAESIGVKPAVINNYTTGKQQSKPGFEVLSKILYRYPTVNIDWLITGHGEMLKTERKNKPFQVLVTTQDTTGNLVVPVINRKAAANYLTGHQTQEYFEQLDSLNLPPSFKKGKQCYALQVSGDSMMPTLQDGDLVVCSLCEASEWEYLNDGEVYVVVSDKGLQVKRIKNQLRTTQEMVFVSDNKSHKPFKLGAEDILELWKVNWRLSPNLQIPADEDIETRVMLLESKLEKLAKKQVVLD